MPRRCAGYFDEALLSGFLGADRDSAGIPLDSPSPYALSAPPRRLPLELGLARRLADCLHGRMLQLPLDGHRVVARMGAFE